MFLTPSRAHQSLEVVLLWYLSSKVIDAISVCLLELTLFHSKDQDPARTFW